MADDVRPETTEDAFFGGRLVLRQPHKGHRSGTDAVLLAAAVPRDFDGSLIDAGSGVGAAGLGVALCCMKARVVLLENDTLTVELAAENIRANGLGQRVQVIACDLLDRDARRAIERNADVVVTNPPFYDGATVRASPSARRSAAHVMAAGTALSDWIAGCLDLLAPKGTLIMVHAASALPSILAGFDGRLGGVTVLAVHPREGEPAKRVLVRATKGSRAPFVIAAPLVLHDGDRFTVGADRLHRGEAALEW